MATAEELLSGVPQHTHQVKDVDPYFVIDPVSRVISCASPLDNVLMQNDHKSERYTFELPRYVEGHDMMLCNKVRIHFNNVRSLGAEVAEDVHDVDDLRIDPDDPDNVICSWLIERNATQYAGVLSFLVQYLCIVDGEEVYEWHTDIYSDVIVKEGRDNSEQAVAQHTNILNQWEERLFGAGDSVLADIRFESETQQTEIEAKGAETLASIPDDYTTTHEMADTALRKKADAIIMSESGHPIFLDDSSDCNIVGLNLYGPQNQVYTTGKNVLNIPENFEFTQSIGQAVNIPAGTYIMSFEGNVTSGDKGLCVRFYDNDVWIILDNNKKAGTVVLSKNETNVYFYSNGTSVSDSANLRGRVNRLMVSTIGGTYEPYTNGKASPYMDNPQPLDVATNPIVNLYGKNLLQNTQHTVTKSGITYTENPDGSITVNGTATGESYYMFDFSNAIPAYDTMLIGSLEGGNGNIALCIGYFKSDGSHVNSIRYIVEGESRFVYPQEAYTTRTYLTVGTGKTITNLTVKPMIRVEDANVDDTFEGPKERAYVPTSHELRGIRVNQNGNFITPDGQQLLCDEIDFERGKHIQRVGVKIFDGSTDEDWAATTTAPIQYYIAVPDKRSNYELVDNILACSHFKCNPEMSVGSNYRGLTCETWYYSGNRNVFFNYDDGEGGVENFKYWLQSNPITLYYELGTPIETDLTSTEMEAFRALRTNATNTTILNTQNAGMQVRYVADLECYIYKNITYKKTRFNLTMKESNWVRSSDGRFYTQVLDINVRPNSEINLHPTAEQQVGLILDGIAMFIANENGVATAYCISSTPGRDITIEATEQVVVYA